ncbi:septum formation initiator family protein [Brachyspira pilosicoli]|uniref:Septum formation initiator family protein n=1 Tax=Brachyspira pilosicoli TaxID=52584 RepID=A0A5C8FBA5_BRAPL|nr:septum formation initiator family protein [Brachyspira pilosicoli]
MQLNIRLRAEIFYGIVVVGLALIIFLFVFSSKGFVSVDKQKQTVEKKRAKIEELDRKKKKILNSIDRLTNDREYILSYAKTFGYLDTSKNEKIIKIIRNDNNKDFYYNSEEYVDNNTEAAAINSRGVIILAIFLAISFAIYVLFVNRHIFIKKHADNNVVNYKGSSM